MLKFKNIFTKTGKITFEGERIEFNDFLETDNKGLIRFLNSSDNWVKIEEKNKAKEAKEAKEEKNKVKEENSFDL